MITKPFDVIDLTNKCINILFPIVLFRYLILFYSHSIYMRLKTLLKSIPRPLISYIRCHTHDDENFYRTLIKFHSKNADDIYLPHRNQETISLPLQNGKGIPSLTYYVTYSIIDHSINLVGKYRKRFSCPYKEAKDNVNTRIFHFVMH